MKWKPIKNFEGRYAVDNTGRVLRCKRVTTYANGIVHFLPSKLLGPSGTKVYLIGPYGKEIHLIAELVLEAFGPPRPPDATAVHMDGDEKNNRIENLKWSETATTKPKKQKRFI